MLQSFPVDVNNCLLSAPYKIYMNQFISKWEQKCILMFWNVWLFLICKKGILDYYTQLSVFNFYHKCSYSKSNCPKNQRVLGFVLTQTNRFYTKWINFIYLVTSLLNTLWSCFYFWLWYVTYTLDLWREITLVFQNTMCVGLHVSIGTCHVHALFNTYFKITYRCMHILTQNISDCTDMTQSRIYKNVVQDYTCACIPESKTYLYRYDENGNTLKSFTYATTKLDILMTTDYYIKPRYKWIKRSDTGYTTDWSVGSWLSMTLATQLADQAKVGNVWHWLISRMSVNSLH